MGIPFTDTQKQRLIELDAAPRTDEAVFDSADERDRSFKALSAALSRKNRERIQRLNEVSRRPALRVLEAELARLLTQAGFVEVCTPTTLSKGMLLKMGITEGHPLWQQVYRLEDGHCLRPMLAPNLYYLLGRLGRLWPRPVRIFEIGQCFRKESKGSKHLSEFTMLNLAEMGMSGDPLDRLVEMAGLVMNGVGLGYELADERSEVYGTTVDIMVDGAEVASGAVGPHPLDAHWNITEGWAGLGVGLERLVMAKEGFHNIRRVGRSLIYQDGARLNV